jgi:hypothetical protein
MQAIGETKWAEYLRSESLVALELITQFRNSYYFDALPFKMRSKKDPSRLILYFVRTSESPACLNIRSQIASVAGLAKTSAAPSISGANMLPELSRDFQNSKGFRSSDIWGIDL